MLQNARIDGDYLGHLGWHSLVTTAFRHHLNLTPRVAQTPRQCPRPDDAGVGVRQSDMPVRSLPRSTSADARERALSLTSGLHVIDSRTRRPACRSLRRIPDCLGAEASNHRVPRPGFSAGTISRVSSHESRYCIVAEAGLRLALPLQAPTGQKQKPDLRRNRLILQPEVRYSGHLSELLRDCRD